MEKQETNCSVGSEHPALKAGGSLVRIQVFPQVDSKFAILFCLMGSAQLV